MDSESHIPVMLPEVLAALSPVAKETYVDGTFGAGGYSRAILAAAPCAVVAIDRDRSAFDAAAAQPHLTLLHGRFGDMEALLREAGIAAADGVVLDIGVSSMQLDRAERGFSFRADGPLDMRMDQSGDLPSAADLLAGVEEEALANLIYQYGDERHSRRIARAIVRARETAPLTTTRQLAEIVRRAQPPSKKIGIDPATRTFQALRIAVNDELGELQRALGAAEHVLCAGGRLVVVTFHSLEDGIVKRFLAERSGRAPSGSRHLPTGGAARPPTFALRGKAIGAGDAEAVRNPRARSARLRAATRTEAAAWPAEAA